MKIFQWIFAGVIAVLLALFGTGKFDSDQQLATPCNDPLSVKIGDVDDRFNITESELIDILHDVADVWSEAADTSVILYSEDGEITVNLVYAEEQQLTDKEKQHMDRLEDEEYSITVLENEYTRLNKQYEKEVRQYDEGSKNLQQSIEKLNEWVVQKNQQGGFSVDDLERFEERKREIDSIKKELAYREEMLKRKATDLNSRISFLNQKIENKNKLVDEYNSTFTGLRRFTQGSYEWNADTRSINVFHFIDKEELTLVIAHEMGHALGIEHVSNPESVMFRLMGNQARPGISLTSEDLQALQNICYSQGYSDSVLFNGANTQEVEG